MNPIIKNASWIIVCKIIQAILALVINMLTARYLGPSNYGLITYAASLVAFAIPLMQLGFSNILVQEIVNKPEQEGVVMGTSMLLSLCSSFVCMIGVLIFAYIANPNEKTTVLVCLLYSTILIFQALDLMQYWFQAKLLSKYTAIASLFAYFTVSAYKAYLLFSHKSIYWFALANTLDYALISICIIIIYFKLGRQKLSFSLKLGELLFNRSKHYIFSSMMVTFFAQTDKVMIKLMIDETATGYYGAALYCAGITSFVFTAVIDSFRPTLFDGWKQSKNVFTERLTLLYSIIIYGSLAQSLFMTILAKPIITLLYGKSYSPATLALQIIVWFTTFSYIGAVRNIWILANEKQKYLWIINLLGALANIGLNVILIPHYGIYGASIASLLTQFFTNFIIGYIIKPITPNNTIMLRSINPKYLLAASRRIIPLH